MTFQEIYDKLLIIYNAKSLTELADKLKVERTTLSGWKSREALGTMLEHLNKLDSNLINQLYNKNTETTFIQHGHKSQQIKMQHNSNGSDINNFGDEVSLHKVDEEIMKICEALISTANALNKKEILKNELTSLIAKLVTL